MYNVYEQLSIKDIANWIASGAIIFGGIIPYVPQYREIKRRDSAEGFSLYVCFTLLIANTLRIFFWFVHLLNIKICGCVVSIHTNTGLYLLQVWETL